MRQSRLPFCDTKHLSVGLEQKGKNTWGVAVYYWYHLEDSASIFWHRQRARAVFFFLSFFLVVPLFLPTMELLSKPLQAAADLDTARCKGQWQSISVLADRYKKYHPDESGTVFIC